MEYYLEKEHELNDGVPEVSPQQVHDNLKHINVIDVRSEEEYSGELGHIDGSVLHTLGEDFDQYCKDLDLKKEYVIVCRSGRRSAAATDNMRAKGFTHVYNMYGGMILWNELKFTVKS